MFRARAFFESAFLLVSFPIIELDSANLAGHGFARFLGYDTSANLGIATGKPAVELGAKIVVRCVPVALFVFCGQPRFAHAVGCGRVCHRAPPAARRAAIRARMV